MLLRKKLIRRILELVFRPNLSFFLYFSFVSISGFKTKEIFLFQGILFPLFLFVLVVLYFPLLYFIFNFTSLSKATKINHVLEHGTVYFLKKKYGKKHKVGGYSMDSGFRVFGALRKKDIIDAFDQMKQELCKKSKSSFFLKNCGTNVYVLQGLSFTMLTGTLLVFFLIPETNFFFVQILLFCDLIVYFFLRYPLGSFFQKRYMMFFEFKEPSIVNIKKTQKKKVFEKNPVYWVKTNYK